MAFSALRRVNINQKERTCYFRHSDVVLNYVRFLYILSFNRHFALHHLLLFAFLIKILCFLDCFAICYVIFPRSLRSRASFKALCNNYVVSLADSLTDGCPLSHVICHLVKIGPCRVCPYPAAKTLNCVFNCMA